jgi:hypothetical protein
MGPWWRFIFVLCRDPKCVASYAIKEFTETRIWKHFLSAKKRNFGFGAPSCKHVTRVYKMGCESPTGFPLADVQNLESRHVWIFSRNSLRDLEKMLQTPGIRRLKSVSPSNSGVILGCRQGHWEHLSGVISGVIPRTYCVVSLFIPRFSRS